MTAMLVTFVVVTVLTLMAREGLRALLWFAERSAKRRDPVDLALLSHVRAVRAIVFGTPRRRTP